MASIFRAEEQATYRKPVPIQARTECNEKQQKLSEM
jgi:hypothetical protein